MRSFIALVPPASNEPNSDLLVFHQAENMRFIKEGFSWAAFLFGPLWALAHLKWLTFGLMLCAISFIIALEYLGAISPEQGTIIMLGLAFIAGFEGNNWLKAGLVRRGWRESGIAIGASKAEAERDFLRIYQPPRADNDLATFHGPASI
jgi:hypothetical protein